MSTLTRVLFVSFELKTAVEFLKVETVGIPFSMQGSSLESCDCTAVESFGRIAVESLSCRGVESLSCIGLRIRLGRSAELLWEAMQIEPLQKQPNIIWQFAIKVPTLAHGR